MDQIVSPRARPSLVLAIALVLAGLGGIAVWFGGAQGRRDGPGPDSGEPASHARSDAGGGQELMPALPPTFEAERHAMGPLSAIMGVAEL